VAFSCLWNSEWDSLQIIQGIHRQRLRFDLCIATLICNKGTPYSRLRCPMVDDPLVLTVEEAARLLGISRGLAYKMIRQGVIPSIRFGRRVVVPRSRLQALIDGERGDTS
jgi:excisionase family DNA binding protein